MRTGKFEQGIISCLQIVAIGMLLHIGFYIGARIAKKMKINTKKDVDKYKGIGISTKKLASEHYGTQDIMF